MITSDMIIKVIKRFAELKKSVMIAEIRGLIFLLRPTQATQHTHEEGPNWTVWGVFTPSHQLC